MSPSKGHDRKRCSIAAVVALVAVVLIATACTSPKNALGPTDSPCFRAIPVAHAAVNDKGHFAGVRYLSIKDLAAALKTAQKFLSRHLSIPQALRQTKSAICVVAYGGRFSTGDVALGWEPTGRPGSLALVVVRVPNVGVIATIITRKPPLRLTRFLPPFA